MADSNEAPGVTQISATTPSAGPVQAQTQTTSPAVVAAPGETQATTLPVTVQAQSTSAIVTAAPGTTQSAPVTKQQTAAPTADGQIQYEILRVRKPDGTIGRIRRPINLPRPAGTAPGPTPSGFAKPTTSGPGQFPKPTAPVPGQGTNPNGPASQALNGQATTNPNPAKNTTAASNTAPVMPQSNDACSVGAVSTTKQESETTKDVTSPSGPTKLVVAPAPNEKTAVANATTDNIRPNPKQPSNPLAPTTDAEPKLIMYRGAPPPSTGVLASFRVLKGLKRVGRHASNVAGAFNPDLRIDDWESGDESCSDDEDDHDTDEEQSDSDQENDKSRSGGGHPDTHSKDGSSSGASHDTDHTYHGEKPGSQASVTGNLNPGLSDQRSALTGLGATRAVAGMVQAPAPARPSANPVQLKSAEPVKSQSSNWLTKRLRKEPVISEKEVTEKEDVEKAKPSGKVPRQLEDHIGDWSRYVVWIIMVILPLLFLGIGVAAAALHRKNAPSTKGDQILAALKIAVSAWPIIFAAIAAQSLRAYATYKVERGIKLMALEQLISSQSVASAVKQPFILRRINLLTPALLALWSLSPLASQAMLNLVSRDVDSVPRSLNVTYLNTWSTNVAFNATIMEDSTIAAKAGYSSTYSRLFLAAFLPPVLAQRTNADFWNNPLVPQWATVMDSVKTNNFKPDANGYYDIGDDSTAYNPWETNSTQWSSLLGLPIDMSEMEKIYYSGVNATHDFEIKTGQLQLNCSQPVAVSGETMYKSTVFGSESASGTLRVAMTPLKNFTLYSMIANNTAVNGVDWANGAWAYTHCGMEMLYLDVMFKCYNLDCYATGIRKTVNPPSTVPSVMGDFSRPLVESSGTSESGISNVFERYLYQMSLYNLDGVATARFTDLTKVTAADISATLTTLVNTFWQIGFAPGYLTGNLDRLAWDGGNSTGIKTERTECDMEVLQPIYQVSWGWFVCLAGCCITLLLAAIFSIFCDVHSISPDILGFASSVARKSKYVDLPVMESTASGADRARELGKVKVMMQDVKPKAEIGRIALGRAHENAERLKAGRMYK